MLSLLSKKGFKKCKKPHEDILNHLYGWCDTLNPNEIISTLMLATVQAFCKETSVGTCTKELREELLALLLTDLKTNIMHLIKKEEEHCNAQSRI